MADQYEYRTLQISMASADGIVVYDSEIGDPKTRGRVGVPLVHYLNDQSVGPAGWKVCGVVPLGTQSTILLIREKHS